MTITFYPHPGDVLICNFDTGFHPPEMVKKRPVVVISKHRRRGAQIVTVVPLSTTAPNPVEDHHYIIDASVLPGRLSHRQTWAKCDMVVSIALNRLDRIMVKGRGGKRTYQTGRLASVDLTSIRQRVGRHIGLVI